MLMMPASSLPEDRSTGGNWAKTLPRSGPRTIERVPTELLMLMMRASSCLKIPALEANDAHLQLPQDPRTGQIGKDITRSGPSTLEQVPTEHLMLMMRASSCLKIPALEEIGQRHCKKLPRRKLGKANLLMDASLLCDICLIMNWCWVVFCRTP